MISPQGIMYYKPIDVKRGIFAKWKIAEESSARIAIGYVKIICPVWFIRLLFFISAAGWPFPRTDL